MNTISALALLVLVPCVIVAEVAAEEERVPAMADSTVVQSSGPGRSGGPGAWARTKSASGRFVVIGPDAASNSQYTRWAEEQALRLERLLAAPLPLTSRAPIEIVVTADRTAGPAIGIERRRGEARSRVLTINEIRVPDYELMQESLCALLLDACVEDRRQAQGRPAGAPAVPTWLSMGMAQNLAAETRNRDRKLVTEWTPRGERPAIATVLGWERLPEGWPRNRALCGMLVLWLASSKDGVGVYSNLLTRLARDESVGVEWVATQFANAGSAAALERVWQEWLDRQSRTVQEFGSLSSTLLDQLRSELDLRLPATAGSGGQARRLTPSDVQAMRSRSAYVRLLADEKVQSIRALTLGKAPELVEVGEAYARFYEGVARDARSMTTKSRLVRAQEALNRLATLTRAREAYLDAVEREWEGADGQGEESSAEIVEPILEKGPIERYLDAAETRFQQSELDKGAGRRSKL